METNTKSTVFVPLTHCCTCGKPMKWKAVRIAEHLMTKEDVHHIVVASKNEAGLPDGNKIKAALAQFDQFEYYGLAYRCDGHILGTRYDWQYTQEDAELAARLLNGEEEADDNF